MDEDLEHKLISRLGEILNRSRLVPEQALIRMEANNDSEPDREDMLRSVQAYGEIAGNLRLLEYCKDVLGTTPALEDAIKNSKMVKTCLEEAFADYLSERE